MPLTRAHSLAHRHKYVEFPFITLQLWDMCEFSLQNESRLCLLEICICLRLEIKILHSVICVGFHFGLTFKIIGEIHISLRMKVKGGRR
jgi:hypothetical protein